MRQSTRKNVNWLWRIGFAIFCLHLSSTVSWTAEQLIDEAVIHKWKAYERFARSLQGTIRMTGASNTKERRAKVVFKQNLNCASRSSLVEGKTAELIRIANPQYAAQLRRRMSNLGDVVLERFTEASLQSSTPKRGERDIFEDVSVEVSPHFYLPHKIPFSQILVDPHFKILRMSKTSENGRELVRLDFRVVNEQPQSGIRAVSSGWVDLDPSRCWCKVRMKRLEKQTKNGARYLDNETEAEFEMVDHPSGFPLMKSMMVHGNQHMYRDKEQTITHWSRYDYEWKVNDHVPDSEFTLSAYGLPEPGSEPMKKSLPLYVWIILAAGISFGLAVGFRFLARRRARSRPAARGGLYLDKR